MLTLIKAQGKANKVKQTTHNHMNFILFFFLRKKSCESESPRYIYIYIKVKNID